MFCREQAAQVRGHLDELRARGADLAVIGNGTPKQAASFVRDRAPGLTVLVDPSLKAYEAAGLKRSVGALFRPSVLKSAWRAMSSGHGQGLTQGDPWQQGGVLVIGKGGELRYAYVSQAPGDHPPIEDVLAALP